MVLCMPIISALESQKKEACSMSERIPTAERVHQVPGQAGLYHKSLTKQTNKNLPHIQMSNSFKSIKI